MDGRTLKSVILLFFLLLMFVGSSRAQDYDFTYTCDDQGQVVWPDSMGFFYPSIFATTLTNTGAQADSYRVIIDNDLPENWYAMACLPGFCFFESCTVELSPAQAETIDVDIFASLFPGAGTTTMRVRSLGDPARTAALPLTAITNTGVDVLIVDDDGTQDYEIYYQAALDSAGKTHGTLDNATTAIGAQKLAPFPAVIWFTGEATPLLTARDRQAISGYLEAGGRLFISGQDIASALCDPASGESDANSIAWFESTFSAAYGGEYTGTFLLNGIAGNSISAGCTLSVSGGDGADNQTAPDVVEPIFGQTYFAYTVFHYSDDDDWPLVGSFTTSTGIYRIVYFAFGFEAIDNAADRALLMGRIMDYFEGSTAVEEGTGIVSRPQNFSLSPNYPNPFNAATTFALYVPVEISVPVSLKIYNVLGQEVRTLMDGPLSPGSHLILWDGTDDAGANLASGVYFSRMESGDFSQTRKIVLTR